MTPTRLLSGLALAAILAAPLAATAQPATAPATAPAAAPSSAPDTEATYIARLERRIERLHTALGITPAQAGAWRVFAQALRANGHDMDALVIARRSALPTMTALENLDSLNQIAATHQRNMERLKSAFAPLYASMLPSQKANADKVLRTRSLRSLRAHAEAGGMRGK